MKHISLLLLSIFSTLCAFSQTVQYQYDALHRLTQATYSTGVTLQYTYDALGNRLQSVVNQNANVNCTSIPTNGLVAYYPFDGNANDMSGNGNHGTVNGATLTTGHTGNANSAYSFDGVNDYISLNHTFGPFTEITVSAWVFVLTSDLQAIVSSNTTEAFHFQIYTTGHIVSYQNPNLGAVGLPIIQTSPTGQWRHLVVVFSSGNSKTYENGVVLATSNQTYTIISSTNLLKIGSGYQNGRFFNGKIDDVSIYNRALSASEIQQLYIGNAVPISAFTTTNNGLTQTFANTSLNASTYSWNFGDGTTSTAQNPSKTYTTAGTYNVCLTATNACGTNSYCQQITVTNCAAFYPTVTSTANNVCIGGTVTLNNTSLGTTPPYTRQWQVSTDNVTFTTATTSTSNYYNVTLNTAGTYYYRLAVIKSGSCTSYSNVTSITVVPDPAITLTGAATFCGNGSTTFTANPQFSGTGTTTLLWQQYIGTTWANIATPGVPTYTTPNLTATRGYRVKMTATGSGCGFVYSNLQNLTINPLPNVSVNPTASTICVGGSKGIAAGGANTYSWSPIAGLNNATSANVISTPSVSTTYTVTGTTTATGCTKTATSTITVVADPVATVSGNLFVCSGNTTTFSLNIAGGTGTYTYQWQSSTNGTSWSSISGATAATYTTPALTASRYYRVSLICTGIGCNATVSNSVFVSVAPAVSVVVSGTNSVCTGGNGTLTASVSGGAGTTAYQWENSPNGTTWTAISGATSTSHTTTPLSTTTLYRLKVSNSGVGCGIYTSAAFTINVVPDMTVVLGGTSPFCGTGSSVLTTNLTGGTGTMSYQWEENVNNAWSVIVGATGNSFTTPQLTATRGYRVIPLATGSGCTGLYSSVFTVTINALPNITVNPTASTICVGGSKGISAGGGNSYTWSPAAGLNTTVGANVTATPSATTTYVVTGTNTSTGCTKTANSTVTVVADPTVSISGNTSVPPNGTTTLTANISGGTGSNTFQWSKGTNGSTYTNVAGATTAVHTTSPLAANTYYRVYVTASGTGCNSIYSNGTLVTVVPIRQGADKGDSSVVWLNNSKELTSITIFPNPTDDELNVVLKNLQKGDEISLRLIDAMGKLVATYNTVADAEVQEAKLSLNALAAGFYSLEVRIGETINTYKVAKE